jgi:hypothetical protein
MTQLWPKAAFSFKFRERIMHAMVLAGVGALTVCGTLPAPSAERNASLNLRPVVSYNAKPGNIGYGDFIDNRVRSASPIHARVEARQ